MPTYRSVTLSLLSQFDALTIPEYAPPAGTAEAAYQRTISLVEAEKAMVSVYVPSYPSSQFWLTYSIRPPHPPGAFFYFKLYLHDVHVVSWGVQVPPGDEGYVGKTMFGLFEAGEDWMGVPAVERRALFFGNDDDDGAGLLEVKVFRARGRKRVPEFENPVKAPNGDTRREEVRTGRGYGGGRGIDLVNAGNLELGHPQRYYKYALMDSLEKPFATFRYYCRSWESLEALGVVPRSHTEVETAVSTSLTTSSDVTSSEEEEGEEEEDEKKVNNDIPGLDSIPPPKESKGTAQPPLSKPTPLVERPRTPYANTSNSRESVVSPSTGRPRVKLDWLRRKTTSLTKRDPRAEATPSPLEGMERARAGSGGRVSLKIALGKAINRKSTSSPAAE